MAMGAMDMKMDGMDGDMSGHQHPAGHEMPHGPGTP